MTIIQEMIVKFIMQNLDKYISPQITDDCYVECFTDNRKKIRLTGNLYCDIMDADTKRIIAVSNIPHDLERVGNKLPTKWEIVKDYADKKGWKYLIILENT